MAIPSNKQPSVRQMQRSKHAKDGQSRPTAEASLTTDDAGTQHKALIDAHLPPMVLTVAVLVCSGFCFVFALRDFLLTGKNVGGLWDQAMLVRSVFGNALLFSFVIL